MQGKIDKRFLMGWQLDIGYRLVEPDDHIVELWFRDRLVKVYPVTITILKLREDATEHYLETMRKSWEKKGRK